MKVRDVMSRDVVAVHPTTPLKETARLMSTYGISGLPVIDDAGSVVGVVSEADFLIKERGSEAVRGGPLERFLGESRETHATRSKIGAVTAGEMMTVPALTIEPEASLREAAELMVRERINRLPVVRGGSLIGIVTRADLVRAYLRPDDELRHVILDDIIVRTLWIAPEGIEVDVREGMVRLAGTVDRRSSAESLESLAANLDGVVSVDSDLRWQFDDREVRLPEVDLVGRGYRR
jgi:CBS domain-containing protein